MYAFYRHEPVFLVIEHDGKEINKIKFISEEIYWQHQALELMDKYTNVIKETLDGYFSGKLKDLDLPHRIDGTDFEQQVWKATQTIPYGQTASYSDIAKIIDNPNSVQAVGNALGKNMLPLIVPCHRVIGSDGELHGFAGGIEIKKFLLELEAKHKV
jgi:methylated-DNA-[protein]-cysteine S-methyltransferase